MSPRHGAALLGAGLDHGQPRRPWRATARPHTASAFPALPPKSATKRRFLQKSLLLCPVSYPRDGFPSLSVALLLLWVDNHDHTCLPGAPVDESGSLPRTPELRKTALRRQRILKEPEIFASVNRSSLRPHSDERSSTHCACHAAITTSLRWSVRSNPHTYNNPLFRPFLDTDHENFCDATGLRQAPGLQSSHDQTAEPSTAPRHAKPLPDPRHQDARSVALPAARDRAARPCPTGAGAARPVHSRPPPSRRPSTTMTSAPDGWPLLTVGTSPGRDGRDHHGRPRRL